MFVGMLLFSQLSASCAASDVAVQGREWIHILAAVARVESRYESLVINDNSTKKIYSPGSRDEAAMIATYLIKRGDKLDLGLMQIDSENLQSLGLSIPDAFDACHSIAAGSRVLRDGYQRALRIAFSIYNTGSASRGIQNGYSDRVEAAAKAVSALPGGDPVAADDEPPPPSVSCVPSWDVWAVATCSDQSSAQPGAAPGRGVVSVSINTRNKKDAE